ncbi:hypothetical protein [Oleiagrimonas soli]|uniref:Uncharacterized protein YceK n=1 Tax=Oleiagrimonas soli TaxID=1543381 RepID=A0A099CYD6_9GAMM|nr:hypothetical protein [Oleiagrimonas soli]KGI78993.1 hypothetical protein LF63_0102010 [Oleiagrimonas soli]MBB6184483.1 uncharacterized protein YceK [Oleiagrimonas soli]
MNKRWTTTTILILLLATLTLAGCATDRRNNALQDTLTAYAAAVRWGSFDQASAFVDPKYLKDHPITHLDMERYHQVRVSEYDDGSGPIRVDDTTVRQVVRIGLINVNTQQQRTVIDRQTWTYDPVKKHWWLESGLPDITPGH